MMQLVVLTVTTMTTNKKKKCKDDNDMIERPTRKAKLIAKRKIKTIYDDNDE